MKVDLGFGLKMVKACDPGARLEMVKVPRLPDPYLPPPGAELEILLTRESTRVSCTIFICKEGGAQRVHDHAG